MGGSEGFIHLLLEHRLEGKTGDGQDFLLYE
jgi:hypothetical protein